VAVLALPSFASAAELEVGGFAGYTFPFYSQSFEYDPGRVTVDIPGVTIDQAGEFELKASGGPVCGGMVTVFPVDPVGFEVRYDRADLTIKTASPSYHVHVAMPSPLPPVDTNLSLTESQADLTAASTFSLNLKLRSSGDTRVYLSGGASHVSDLGFSMEQTVALGVSAVNLIDSTLEISTIPLTARRKPGDPKSNWGLNAGLGVRIPLGEHGGLLLEGRGFLFRQQTYEWELDPALAAQLGAIQTALWEQVKARLEPVKFRPWWVQATIGVCYRF
jgi:hypothetical protein